MSSASKGKVLIIDDEEILQEILNEIFIFMNIETIVAGNGEDGIRMYREHADEIDLILLDLMMPGMSGGEVYEKISQIHENVKILFMSGFPEKEALRRIQSKGNHDFIKKPFSLDEIQEKIESMLDELHAEP
jgi:two-component system cell cycle sensor histidine kinase/response regulator CckA